MRIPISLKLIAFAATLISVTTLFFAQKISENIAQVLTLREEFEISRRTQAQAREVESLLTNLGKKTQVIAQSLIATTPAYSSKVDTENRREIGAQASTLKPQTSIPLLTDSDLFAIQVFQYDRGRFRLLSESQNEEKMHQAQMTLNDLKKIRSLYGFPLEALLNEKIQYLNSTLPHGVPVMSFGIPLTRNETGAVQTVAVGIFDLALFQKLFTNSADKTHTAFLVDSQNNLLAHTEESLALARFTMKEHPVLAIAQENEHALNLQKHYQDPKSGLAMIGAYTKVQNQMFDVFVVTTVEEKTVLEPSEQVKMDSILLAGKVLAVAFFLAFLFSLSISSPIEILAELMQRVREGNFNVSAKKLIWSHDEVGDLAGAFDKMMVGLRERDKVKNLFTKFHGSSITQNLLQHEIGRRGDKRKATVFFSDIRGFTSMSEKMPPEKVVEMLNEYFSVMVEIINRNHGVVDKFIGDAIMAVWGAPNSTPNDSENAIRACLEMRKALVELNASRIARGLDEIRIGMGLHTGDVIAGTLGSEERLEYTVIGDTVNLASRIEASTKSFGTDLLISEDVSHALGEKIQANFAGLAEVKGKSEPVGLYRVSGMLNRSGEMELFQSPYSHFEPEEDEKIKVAG